MKLKINQRDFTNIYMMIVIAASVLIFNSCRNSELAESPPAFLEITDGPSDNSTLTKSTVTFAWKGANSNYKFRYRLLSIGSDNLPSTYQDWSNYADVLKTTFYDLDEGKFKFEVQGKSKNVESSVVSRSFTVDVVQPPSILFFKTKTTIKYQTVGSVGLWMEGIDSLQSFNIVIFFDKSRLNLIDVSTGQYVLQKKFNQIILPDFTRSEVRNEVNNSGKLEINSAMLMNLQTYPSRSISGSGILLDISFKGIAMGQSTLQITTLTLKDERDRSIVLKSVKNGTVIVE